MKRESWTPNLNLLVAAFLAFIAMLWVLPAHAAVDEPPPPPTEACKLNFATGTHGKGYSKIYANIVQVCGQTVPLCEVPTTGGLENLMNMSANTADIGLVQVDTMKDMAGGDANINNLQVVANVGLNLMHVVTLTNGFNVSQTVKAEKKWGFIGSGTKTETVNQRVTKFSDFKNIKYPIALVGTAKLMGRSLDRSLGYGLNFVDYDKDDAALADLKAGKVWAVFTVSAWPNGALQNATSASGYTLIPFDLSPQGNYTIVKKPYPKMNVYGMPFLAVPNVLVTRPFRADGPNGRNVAALQACIVRNLGDLKEGSFEPTWSDVQNPLDTFGLKAFVPGGVYTSPNMATPTKKRH